MVILFFELEVVDWGHASLPVLHINWQVHVVLLLLLFNFDSGVGDYVGRDQ